MITTSPVQKGMGTTFKISRSDDNTTYYFLSKAYDANRDSEISHLKSREILINLEGNCTPYYPAQN